MILTRFKIYRYHDFLYNDALHLSGKSRKIAFTETMWINLKLILKWTVTNGIQIAYKFYNVTGYIDQSESCFVSKFHHNADHYKGKQGTWIVNLSNNFEISFKAKVRLVLMLGLLFKFKDKLFGSLFHLRNAFLWRNWNCVLFKVFFRRNEFLGWS